MTLTIISIAVGLPKYSTSSSSRCRFSDGISIPLAVLRAGRHRRKSNREDCASTGPAIYLDAPAPGARDAINDGEAKSGAARWPLCRKKRFENSGADELAHTRPIVGDDKHRLTRGRTPDRNADRESPTVVRVHAFRFGRVFHQIRHDLHQAEVLGAGSLPHTLGRKCWPVRFGQVTVPLWKVPPAYTNIVRIGYLWYSGVPASVIVQYGTTSQTVQLLPRLHSLYVPVSGQATSIIISGVPGPGLCVGDAQAGNIGAAANGLMFPPAGKY